MKIAMGQLLVEGGEPERNLERAQTLIEKAAKQQADLILLPETLDLAWTHPSIYKEAETIPGDRSNFFCQLAIKNNIWICLGLSEKDGEDLYNSAILIDNKGRIIHKYRKINLLEVEFPFYNVGQQLSVVTTPFGKIGINICADNYIGAVCLGHSLARMGAQIILSPSSWTVDHFITEEMNPYQDKWIKPLSELVETYEIPVVSTTSVGYIVGGPYEGKKMIGCSLAIDRNGDLTQGEFNEFAGDLKLVDLTLGEAKWKGVQYAKMIAEKRSSFSSKPLKN